MEQHGESSRSHQIFRQQDGSPMRIWLDPKLPTLSSLLNLIQANGGQVSTTHDDPHTRLLILQPSSVNIFDRYCHPVWLSPEGRKMRQEAVRAEEVDEEEWRRKVILTERWPKMCVVEGKIMGEDLNWGGYRKGGPPALTRKPSPAPRQMEAPTARQPQIAPIPSPIIQLPPSPVSPPPDTIAPQSTINESEPEIQVIEPPPPRSQSRPADMGFPPTIFQRSPMSQPSVPSAQEQKDTNHRDVPPHVQNDVAASQEHTNLRDVPLSRQGNTLQAVSATPEAATLPTQSIDPPLPTSTRLLAWSPKFQSKKFSKWQEALSYQPPRILDGLRFFISSGRRGRKQTVKYIRQSGGVEVTEIKYATHALMAPTSPSEEMKLRGLMPSAMANGAWCLLFDWVEASWDAGEKLPELPWAYKGGIPPNPTSTTPLKPVSNVQPTTRHPKSGHLVSQNSTPSAPTASTSTQDLDRLIRNAHPLSLIPGNTQASVAKKLHQSNSQYSELTWLAMYKNWLKHAGPFVPTPEDQKYNILSGLFPRYLPLVRNGESLEDISTQLVKNHPNIKLSAEAWNQHFGNWLRAGELGEAPVPSLHGPMGRPMTHMEWPNMALSSNPNNPSNAIPAKQINLPLSSNRGSSATALSEKSRAPLPLNLAVSARPKAEKQPIFRSKPGSATQSEAVPPRDPSPVRRPPTPPPPVQTPPPPTPPLPPVDPVDNRPKPILPLPHRSTLSLSLPPKSTTQPPPKVKLSLQPNIPQSQTRALPTSSKPANLPESSSVEVEVPSTMKRDVIARMFKLNFNSERHSSKHVAVSLAGMPIPTLQKVYRAWRDGVAPFNESLSPDLAYTNDGRFAPARLASKADLDSEAHPAKRLRST